MLSYSSLVKIWFITDKKPKLTLVTEYKTSESAVIRPGLIIPDLIRPGPGPPPPHPGVTCLQWN